MTFDLNTLALSTEAEALHLTHPVTELPLYAPVAKGEDPESKPVRILLHGTASKQYRKAVDAMLKRNAKRGRREATPDESREASVDFLVALSVSTENLSLDGEEINSPEMFKKLYSDDRFSWVKAQADSFLSATESFLQA